MNFIKLTLANGIQPVFINVDKIVTIYLPEGATATNIIISETWGYAVMETPEQIFATLGRKVLSCGTTSSATGSSAAVIDSQCGQTLNLNMGARYTFVPDAEMPGAGSPEWQALMGGWKPKSGFLFAGDVVSTPGSIPLAAAS